MVWFALHGCVSAGAEMSMLSSSLRVWWCSEHNWRFLTISRHSILLSISNMSLSCFQYFLRKFELFMSEWIAIRYSCGINNQFIDIFNKFSWPLCEHYFSSCSPLDQTSHLIHPNEHYIFWLLEPATCNNTCKSREWRTIPSRTYFPKSSTVDNKQQSNLQNWKQYKLDYFSLDVFCSGIELLLSRFTCSLHIILQGIIGIWGWIII